MYTLYAALVESLHFQKLLNHFMLSRSIFLIICVYFKDFFYTFLFYIYIFAPNAAFFRAVY